MIARPLAAALILLLAGAAPPPEDAAAAPALPAIVAGQLSGPHATIHFTERARGAAPAVLPRLESERATFPGALGGPWPRPITVRLGAGRGELEALALPGAAPPSWAVAVAYPEHGLMLLDALALSDPANASTIRHELAHLALGQVGAFPRWFHEGLAVLLSGEDFDLAHYAAMYRGVSQDRLASFELLGDRWPEHRSEVEIAYAQSCSFVAFLLDHHGPAAFDELFRHVAAGAPFELAFARAFHASLGSEERGWRRTLERHYASLPVAAAVSLFWGASALLCVAAFLRRRAAKERNLQRMDTELAAEGGWVEPQAGERPLPPEAEVVDPGELPRTLH